MIELLKQFPLLAFLIGTGMAGVIFYFANKNVFKWQAAQCFPAFGTLDGPDNTVISGGGTIKTETWTGDHPPLPAKIYNVTVVTTLSEECNPP